MFSVTYSRPSQYIGGHDEHMGLSSGGHYGKGCTPLLSGLYVY